MLNLIQCTPKPSKGEIWQRAYERKLVSILNDENRPSITDTMSIVFMGVKVYSLNRDNIKDLDYLIGKFKCMEDIKYLMSCLTPKQFVDTFPIRKTYDGDRYEHKDYFFTKKMVDSLNQDAQIGAGIEDFLWDYMNYDTQIFSVTLFGLMSDIMRAKGEPGMMERMSADLGIPLYYEDKKGKGITGPIQVKKVDDCYCYDDSKAKTVPLKQARPDYLRPVD